MKETMPKTVTITRTFTYDVAGIVETFEHIWGTDISQVWQSVEEVINDWVHEDMRSPIHPRELVWTDEEGNEL